MIPRAILRTLSVLLLFTTLLQAQELKVQPTPFTVYLDFKTLFAPSAQRPSFPIWLESVNIDPQKNQDGVVVKTNFRFRVRKFAGINDELMMRVFFDDQKDASPVVSAWNEIGQRALDPRELGQGIGLPTAETVTIQMADVDYIEVEVPGDGANVRGAFLSSVRKTETRAALDFEPHADLADPFQGASPAPARENDAYLFGRVKAALDDAILKLSARDGASSTVEFNLASQPLLAVITFEILNVDVKFPPELIVNNHPLGPVAMALPDLADPAFVGNVRPLERDMHFNYTGWLKCQKIVAGSSLQAGLNRLILQLSDPSGSVAVRAIEVQLKYNWDKLDYNLAP